MAKSVEDYIIDFTKEEKGSGSARVKKGIYKVRVLAAKPTVSSEKGTEGLEVTFVIAGGKYAKSKIVDTLWATPKAYGRFRTLLEACGKKVPSRVTLSKVAAAIKGANLYIDIQDEKREGYSTRSRVTFDGFINEDDYEAEDSEDDGEDDEESEDEEDEEEDEDSDEDEEDEEDEDDEDDEEEEPAPKRAAKKAPAKRSATKKAPAKKRKADDEDEDEDLSELDLEDL